MVRNTVSLDLAGQGSWPAHSSLYCQLSAAWPLYPLLFTALFKCFSRRDSLLTWPSVNTFTGVIAPARLPPQKGIYEERDPTFAPKAPQTYLNFGQIWHFWRDF